MNLPRPVFPHPTLSMAVRVKQKGDESKISGALQRLMEEDPTIGYEVNAETVEQVLSGLGEQHLDVVCAKLKSKLWRRGTLQTAHSLPRVHPQKVQGAGPPQKTDGRPWPVWRCVD